MGPHDVRIFLKELFDIKNPCGRTLFKCAEIDGINPSRQYGFKFEACIGHEYFGGGPVIFEIGSVDFIDDKAIEKFFLEKKLIPAAFDEYFGKIVLKDFRAPIGGRIHFRDDPMFGRFFDNFVAAFLKKITLVADRLAVITLHNKFDRACNREVLVHMRADIGLKPLQRHAGQGHGARLKPKEN